MFGVPTILDIYAAGIRRISGARTVSIFLEKDRGSSAEPQLIHVGDHEPVPELLDLETAAGFASAAEEKLGRPALDGDGCTPSAFPSAADDGVLLPIPSAESAALSFERASGRPDRRSPADTGAPFGWLGLRLGSAASRNAIADDLRSAVFGGGNPPSVTELQKWILELGGALATYQVRFVDSARDSLTGLPGRSALQHVLAEEMVRARSAPRQFALAFFNPDDFAAINHQHGREAGDQVVREVAARLASTIRRGDFAARFGGVIFAVVISDSSEHKAAAVCDRIHSTLTNSEFLEGAVRLDFSVGIAAFDPEDSALQSPLDLVWRTDQALGAVKRRGGGYVMEWASAKDAGQVAPVDRLSGIFTGNMSKDYRNMSMLWEVLEAMSSDTDPERLMDRSLETLRAAIDLRRIRLLVTDEDGALRPARMLQREPNGPPVFSSQFGLDRDLQDLVERACSEGVAVIGAVGARNGRGGRGCAIPLELGGAVVGCLCLDGRADELVLESADTVFLQALARQLAVALDRARLAQAERRRLDVERRRLRADLGELRGALEKARFVFRSREIEDLLATIRRIAPTDVTVLVTGESGTGKELVARTVHDLSSVRKRPFVVVDCGAIPPTLIESELFGHEKGAYTGAGHRTRGRLEEASGGTVFLDEVSELPLEVQSRLLRFVQEKELTRVGATDSRRIEVRIIAASNRDLPAEVAAQRFREDLYHRLNVVHLHVPPLRARRDDVLHIARHYLETFAVTYQKAVHRFTPAAEGLLERYHWPGNVRELQNTIMKAVLLCDSDSVDVRDLEALRAATSEDDRSRTGVAGEALRDPVHAPAQSPDDAGGSEAGDGGNTWHRLRVELFKEIESAIEADAVIARPLGKWLAEDLLLAAFSATKVSRHAAEMLGIPETTFGRNLRRAQANASAGIIRRSATWSSVRSLLGLLVNEDGAGGELLKRCEELLVEEVERAAGGNVRLGAALVGVTPPTYRRRLERAVLS